MTKLVLTMTMSLDGFFSGPDGELDWMTQAPDPEFSRDNVSASGSSTSTSSPCTRSRSVSASRYSPAETTWS